MEMLTSVKKVDGSNVMDLERVRLSEARQKVGNNLRHPFQVESTKKKRREMIQIKLLTAQRETRGYREGTYHCQGEGMLPFTHQIVSNSP